MPKINLRWPSFLSRLFEGEPTMYEVTRRIERAAESILGNEGLTADLDDSAAKVLLDWGVACAEKVAGSTDGLGDSEAEGVIEPRLRATRRLMRRVNQWVASRPNIDTKEGAELLSQIIEQAATIYGDSFVPPDDDQRTSFLVQQGELNDDPIQFIAGLRELLEKPSNISLTDQGEDNDQEVHIEEFLNREIHIEETQQFGSAELYEPDHSHSDPGGDTAPGRILPLDRF
jgi:hypothetical protein